MADTYHLMRRKGVWYFRRRVPDHLVSIIGKKVIQESLGTKNKAEAKKLREAWDFRWSAEFQKAELDLENSKTATPDESAEPCRPLSEPAAIRLVREYVEQMGDRWRKWIVADGPASEQERRAVVADTEYGLQMLRDLDDPRGAEQVHEVVEKLTAATGRSPDGWGAEQQFYELVRRALVEIGRRKLADLADDHGRRFFDVHFDPTRPVDVTLGELCEQFVHLKHDDATQNRTSQKYLDKVEANLDLIREIVGDDTLVKNIDYDTCLRIRSLLARIPANRTKFYPGLPLDQAITRARAEGRAALAPITQGQYLGTLRELLDLACKKGLIARNYADDLRPLKRDSIAPDQKRLPFTQDQLKALFESQFYRSCAYGTGPAYQTALKPWRFWLPLLCLFMGMRPREVCQLHTSDLRRTTKGTWYVDVVVSDDEGEPASHGVVRTLKTKSSRRRIPVHPELIAIGFVQFVEYRSQSSGDPRLFPDLKPNKYGDPAHYPLRRFREVYLPQAISMKPGQSFYSFRHTFRDELRRIEAPPDALQALGAWSQGKLVSDTYGDKSNPDYLIKYMQQIEFPGLDLSHLQARAAGSQTRDGPVSIKIIKHRSSNGTKNGTATRPSRRGKPMGDGSDRAGLPLPSRQAQVLADKPQRRSRSRVRAVFRQGDLPDG